DDTVHKKSSAMTTERSQNSTGGAPPAETPRPDADFTDRSGPEGPPGPGDASGVETMLSMRHLRKTFAGSADTTLTPADGETDRVVAVSDVSIDVEPGQFFTLLGPSGCGKTTTLRMLAGLAQPDSGKIA